MREWTPKVYELSRDRVRELKCFCQQYRGKRARISAMRDGGGGTMDGQPHGKGGISRPTEQRAIYAAESKDARDVQMIEDAAREAADGSTAMYNCLIANVCDSVLPEHMQVPSGRRQFYEMRRRFFWLLDTKR